jgi:acyl-CoA synthetase (AMP-forming)/AMP-acid ligase II
VSALLFSAGRKRRCLNVAISANATVLPINPNLPAAELREELKRIRLHALVVPGDGWHSAMGRRRRRRRRPLQGQQGRFLLRGDCARTGEGSSPSAPSGQVTEQSWAAIFRTSGTTGPSKRVPVTHQNLIEMARKMERWLALTPADPFGLHHADLLQRRLQGDAGGAASGRLQAWRLPAQAGAHDIEQWLGELRPTWLTASPAFLQAVVEKLRGSSGGAAGLPALRPVDGLLSSRSHPARADAPARQACRRVLRPLRSGHDDRAGALVGRQAGSVGRIPAGELAIRDDNGVVRPGQVGQVMLRGPSVMPGYLLDDIEGEPTGLVDGWLATGDLGSVDERGLLTIVGRTKEIINRGGEKISPYDVEKALLAHPAVREAAAFAVPHARLGENVGAAVVLHPGADATSTDLIDFAYERLAPFQRPRHVHIVRQPAGRPDRQDLTATTLRRFRRRQAGHAAACRAAGDPDRRDLAATAEARRHRHG